MPLVLHCLCCNINTALTTPCGALKRLSTWVAPYTVYGVWLEVCCGSFDHVWEVFRVVREDSCGAFIVKWDVAFSSASDEEV